MFLFGCPLLPWRCLGFFFDTGVVECWVINLFGLDQCEQPDSKHKFVIWVVHIENRLSTQLLQLFTQGM